MAVHENHDTVACRDPRHVRIRLGVVAELDLPPDLIPNEDGFIIHDATPDEHTTWIEEVCLGVPGYMASKLTMTEYANQVAEISAEEMSRFTEDEKRSTALQTGIDVTKVTIARILADYMKNTTESERPYTVEEEAAHVAASLEFLSVQFGAALFERWENRR